MSGKRRASVLQMPPPLRLRPLRAAIMLVSPLLRGSPVKAGALPVTFVGASAVELLASGVAWDSSAGRLIETVLERDCGGCTEEVAFEVGVELEWPSGSTTLTSLTPSPPFAEVGFSGFAMLVLDGARGTRFSDPRSTPAEVVMLRFPRDFCFAGEMAAA